MMKRLAFLLAIGLVVSCSGDDDGNSRNGGGPPPPPPEPSRWHVTLENRFFAEGVKTACNCPEPPWPDDYLCTGAPHDKLWSVSTIRRLQAELLITGTEEIEAVWIRAHTLASNPACGMVVCQEGWCVDFHDTGVAVSVSPPTELLSSNISGDEIYLDFGETGTWSEDNTYEPGYYVDGNYWPRPAIRTGWGDAIHVVWFPYESGVTSIEGAWGGFTGVLTCLENCPNRDCTQSCDDANPCTTDDCVPGEGCRHTKLNSGSCHFDDCHEAGQCIDGHCVSETPVDCDDANPCTDDFCDPFTGCLNLANSVELTDTDPTDCMTDRCLNGVPDQVPNGHETPLQNAPDDCLREVCLEGVGVESAPDMDEPNCDCVDDSDCDDINPCTRDSCDSLECTNTPDDTLEPPQVSPFDCVKQVCRSGKIQIEPEAEIPPDTNPYDCVTEICENGQLTTTPDNEEIPVQELHNCAYEICFDGRVFHEPWAEDAPLNYNTTDCLRPVCNENGWVEQVAWPEEPGCTP